MTCWRVLGLARTDDVAAIRRAYATKLKALDTDRDTAGFQMLRQARDEAIHRAQSEGVAPLEPADDGAAWGLGPADDGAVIDAYDRDGNAAAAVAERPAEEAQIADEADEEDEGEDEDEDEDNTAWVALYDLLRPEDRELDRHYPDTTSAEAMTAMFNAIVGDPRMDRIDFFDHREQWLAHVIAMAWPTSDPLVEPAVSHFDWESRADLVGEYGAIAFLVERMRTDAFVHALRQPGHPLKRAWIELNKPATERSFRNWSVRRSDVRTLLQRIRAEFPSIEDTLDPWRVALWDKSLEGPRWHRTATGILVIVLINVALRLPGCDLDPATAPTAGPAVETLADAYRATSFAPIVPIDTIFDRNRPLWSRLTAQLNTRRSQGASSVELINAVETMLAAHIDDVIADPPTPLVEPLAQLHLAHAVAARKQGWDACVAVLYGGASQPPPLPEELAPRINALKAQALLAPAPPATDRREAKDKVRIDPDIFRQIGQKTGLSQTVLRDALMNKGQEKARCDARIAAIEVALDLPPKRGEPLLRVLSH